MWLNIEEMAQVNDIKISLKCGQKGLVDTGEPGPVVGWPVSQSPPEPNSTVPEGYRGPVRLPTEVDRPATYTWNQFKKYTPNRPKGLIKQATHFSINSKA